MLQKRFLIIGNLILLILIPFVIGFTIKSQPKTQQGNVIWAKDFGTGIRAWAINDNNEVELFVKRPHTKAEVDQYIRSNQLLMQQLPKDGAEPILVAITFNKPLGLQKAEELVIKYNLKPTETTFRVLDKMNLRGTIVSKDWSAGLEQMIQNVTSRRGEKYIGVVGLEGILHGNQKTMTEITRDPEIAIVDVHGEIARKILTNELRVGKRIDVHVWPLHWVLGL